MCGIAGFFSTDAHQRLDAFRQGVQSLAHRGPDNQTVLPIGNGFFGHLRLAIIDLAEAANQPFVVDGKYHLIFNGEIYNYQEVRQRLSRDHGVVFRTNSDTEVIVQAYIHYGESCLDQLNGMFALAIHDNVRNKLFVARDRVGKKPLYYLSTPTSFGFASEIKALLPLLDKKPALSPYAVNEFLSIGYIIAPRTIYEGISKLEPGHWMSVDLENFSVTKREYWDVLKASPTDDHGRLDALVRNSVEARYVADVPVGIMLSGGLDSNIVLALSKEHKPKTFTIKSDHSDYDESELAAYSAREMGVENVVRVNKPDPTVIDKLVFHYDEPMADSSAIPTFLLSQFIHEARYKCVLNGDGADEIFGGYDRYKFLLIYDRFRFLRHLIPSFRSVRYKSLLYNLGFLKKLLSEPTIEEAYAERNLINKGFAGKRLEGMDYKQELVKRIGSIPVQGLNKFLVFDYKYYLPDDLLVKMDRATMANSVESRSPFLDYRLAEALLKVDFRKKVGLFRNKKILRSLYSALLPQRLLKQRKRGFQVPIDHWFQNEMRSEVLALKDAHIIRDGWVDLEFVNRVVERHLGNMENMKFQIYLLLVFEKWYKRWVIG